MKNLIIITFMLVGHLANSQCNPAIPNNSIVIISNAAGNDDGIPYWVCEDNMYVTKDNNTIYLENGTSVTSNKCCQTVYAPAGAIVNLNGCCNTIYYVNASDLISIGASTTTIQCTSITYDYSNAPDDGCDILPVTLLSFTGKNNDSDNIITWVTASEVNNNFFKIDKSSEGVFFKELAIIKGAGNSNSILYYILVDSEPYDTVTYYKLTQIDYNGSSQSFNIIGVYKAPKNDLKIIKITDILGREVEENCNCVKIYYFSDSRFIKKYSLK